MSTRTQRSGGVASAASSLSSLSSSSSASSRDRDDDGDDDSGSGSASSSLSSSSMSSRTSSRSNSPQQPQTRQQQRHHHAAQRNDNSNNNNNNTNKGGGEELAGRGNTPHVRLNPQLRFERADNEYIVMPPLRDVQQVSLVLRRLLCDRERYPEGRHRMLDYFRVAVEMFVAQLRSEYVQQYRAARQQGRPLARFTWRNKGELAVCYACCCDMLKLLYDTLQPGPLKPLWDTFVHQLFPLLMSESGVPSSLLTLHTYHTKFMDWQKGGTRYHGEQSATNVRFPSALERRAKIETYLRSGTGYKLEAVSVNASSNSNNSSNSSNNAMPAATTTAAVVAATRVEGGATSRTPLLPAVLVGSKVPGAMARIATVRPPLRALVKGSMMMTATATTTAATTGALLPASSPAFAAAAGASSSAAYAAMSSSRDDAATPPPPASPELRHLQWLSTFVHITGSSSGCYSGGSSSSADATTSDGDDSGGSSTDAFPDERAQLMPAFVRMCEMTELPLQMRLLIDTIAASSECMQMLFERLGGMVALRRMAAQLIQASNSVLLMHLIERLVRMRLHTWGSTSQRAWRTNGAQRLTSDLTWLRSEGSIPAHKRAAWGAMVLLMEHKYIFSAARDDAYNDNNSSSSEGSGSSDTCGAVTRKRARALPAYPRSVHAAATPAPDKADMARWQLPRVNTLLALRLPYDVAVPPLALSSSDDVQQQHQRNDWLARKRAFARRTQATWERRLRAVLQDNHVSADEVRIPLWYDPYQLLDVAPPLPQHEQQQQQHTA